MCIMTLGNVNEFVTRLPHQLLEHIILCNNVVCIFQIRFTRECRSWKSIRYFLFFFISKSFEFLIDFHFRLPLKIHWTNRHYRLYLESCWFKCMIWTVCGDGMMNRNQISLSTLVTKKWCWKKVIEWINRNTWWSSNKECKQKHIVQMANTWW